MKIDVLCSSPDHPVVPYLETWCAKSEYNTRLIFSVAETAVGKILFLVSCGELVNAETRSKYDHVLVLHASDLPAGRGWSPHIWELLNGSGDITLSLLYADESVDCGDILAKKNIEIPKHYLWDEINAALFRAEISLLNTGISLINQNRKPVPQASDVAATYYQRRNPCDSQVDHSRSLEELFNQIRLADPCRYPAYFKLNDHVYEITLKKRKVVKNDD